jgi:hypothetical protein
MFDPTSRYNAIETATYSTLNGRVITYKRRRFLPRGREMSVLSEVVVNQGDQLHLIAARTIGNPEHFWRICDINNAMNPFGLTVEPGHVLRIPVPQFEEPK